MLTITTRLTLWYIAIIGGTIVVVAGVMYTVFASRQRSDFDAELQNYASFLIAEVNTNAKSIPLLYEDLDRITSQANMRFGSMKFVLSTKDDFVLDSSDVQLDSLLDRLQIRTLERSGITLQTVTAGGTDYRVLIRAVPNTLSNDIRLVAISSLADLQQQLEGLRTLLLIVVPVSLLLAGFLGVFLSRRALRPVKQLTMAATEVSLGSLHQRVPVSKSADEVAQLAMTFNEMIDRLERAFSSQRQFITDASHDLRTPLTIIRAELELLLGREEMTSAMARPISHSLREIEKLTTLANDLLLLVKAESKQFDAPRRRVRLDELLVQCASDLNSLAVRKGTLLNVRIDEAVEIECDAPKVQRAITNILDNAIEYSPDCSRVTVELTELDNTARVVISDNGIGIPELDMPRIFDRFYRSDRSRNTEGSGLGLAIAKAVIEAHGGSITLTSAEGVGTRVTFTLPVTDTR